MMFEKTVYVLMTLSFLYGSGIVPYYLFMYKVPHNYIKCHLYHKVVRGWDQLAEKMLAREPPLPLPPEGPASIIVHCNPYFI